MLQKQDAICWTLQGIKASRRPAAEGPDPAPGNQPPPRTSPPQPDKPVNWDQSVPSTEPAGRQHRVARRILICEAICENINKLLKREKKKKDPLPPPPPDEIRYPTIENFGIRWEEMEKSLFNQMAATIVFEQVCKNWQADPLTKSELEELPAMASEHIRYLCRTWKDSQRVDAVDFKKAQLLSASAASRRATVGDVVLLPQLYESRLKIIDHFPSALNMHRNLIIWLGIAGTSSDQEDPGRKGVFLIKRRPELSSQGHILKSKLDLAYMLYCKGPGSKGSAMHTREPLDKVSARPLWVQGLLVTCLSCVWLHTLSKPEREFYQFVRHKYNYAFPDELLKRNFGRDPLAMTGSDDEMEGGEDEEL
ncbi:hypothetical protein FS749_013499 [Ceratobasidium sp. UAMH 11750]|nr:hypothetical protein FS749_013499 [Ceratobasidium sp. UAMH 11750]